ncbi:uncharacterized protein LOC5511257 isoform X2 [Nematostella vectensis]|uniref:uncharacterized protein LOC5511257 isoform X2 n=1 Tax=Nematostella vectensis TaxID=45351 RepID=UPI0020774DB8|nr:uncharacterized protein LOC5511257 isoform X2 [Nematostella vectensis]
MNLSIFLILSLLAINALAVYGARKQSKRHRFPRPKAWMVYSADPVQSDEANDCFDVRPQCHRWASHDQYCVYASYFMKRNCRKTCKYCDASIGSFEEGREGCEDALEDCPKYMKSQEQCNLFSGMARKYCARTCGFCCSDRIPDCSIFIRNPSQCKGLNGFFRNYCPKTCKMCGSILPIKLPGCADELDDCSVFAKNDQCGVHKLFCSKYCAQSCGFCNNGATKGPKTDAHSVKPNTAAPVGQDTAPPPVPTTLTPAHPDTTQTPAPTTGIPEKEVMKEVSTGFLSKSKPLVPPTEISGPGPKETLPPTPATLPPTTVPPAPAPVPDKGFVDGGLRKGSCIDLLAECKDYVLENPDYCKYHVRFMKKHCNKSCGFCDLITEEPPTQYEEGNKPLPKCVDKRKKKCLMYSHFVGYCQSNKKFMMRNCPASCGFCGSPPILSPKNMASRMANKKYEFDIKTEWDGKAISHQPIKIKLSAADSANVRLEVSGPYFGDPAPPCKPGPCWQLWDYEVAEVFFLGEKEKYFELEVAPGGQHLLLLLNGVRKPFKTKLPLRYTATIDQSAKTWAGNATIPLEYFPPGVRKINAYAIHGTGAQRTYQSLYPADKSLSGPDFHALQFFKDFDFKSMFTSGWNQGPPSAYWV